MRLAERLENERPVPRAAFRRELRRLLILPRRSATGVRRYRALVASYVALAFLSLSGGGGAARRGRAIHDLIAPPRAKRKLAQTVRKIRKPLRC